MEWYVGEPNEYYNGHSIYSAPKDLEKKQQYTAERLTSIGCTKETENRWNSVWTLPTGEDGYIIDYWEDKFPISEQIDAIIEYVEVCLRR